MRAILVFVLLAAAGCYDPKVGSALLSCSSDGKCPAGLYCAPDRRCWRPGDNALGKAPARAAGSLVGGAAEMRSTSYRMMGGLTIGGNGNGSSAGFVVVDGVSSPQGRTR